MENGKIITGIGLFVITTYTIKELLKFYDVNIASIGIYISFYLFMGFSIYILQNPFKLTNMFNQSQETTTSIITDTIPTPSAPAQEPSILPLNSSIPSSSNQEIQL